MIQKHFRLLMFGLVIYASLLLFSEFFQDYQKLEPISLDRSKNQNIFTMSNNFDNVKNIKIIKKTPKINIDLTLYELEDIERKLQKNSIEFGGKYLPKKNQSVQNIAIIMPYRDRLSNLKIFLTNMHPFFIKQDINYGLYLGTHLFQFFFIIINTYFSFF